MSFLSSEEREREGVIKCGKMKASVRDEKRSLSSQSHRGGKVNVEIDESELFIFVIFGRFSAKNSEI